MGFYLFGRFCAAVLILLTLASAALGAPVLFFLITGWAY